MRKISLLAAALGTVVATPTLAQESGTTVFVGPIVGYDNVKLSDGTYSESDDGVMYGVIAGADFVIGSSAFAGIEAEYSDSEVGETVNDIDVVGDSASIEAGRNLYIGGRLGYLIGGGGKLYMKGGYSNAQVKGTYDDTVDTYSVSDELNGWVAGVGTDFPISPVLIRLEYRYSDYEDIEVLGINSGIGASRHQVVAGALFSF